MKIAVIGSGSLILIHKQIDVISSFVEASKIEITLFRLFMNKHLIVDVSKYIHSQNATELISDVYAGIDSIGEKYGQVAPLKRNEGLVDMSDMILAVYECARLEPVYNLSYFLF